MRQPLVTASENKIMVVLKLILIVTVTAVIAKLIDVVIVTEKGLAEIKKTKKIKKR